MKPIKLIPKKTPAGWCLNIPPALSTTGKRQRQFFQSRDEAEKVALPLREKHRASDAAGIVLPKMEATAAQKALALLAEKGLSPLVLIEAVERLLAARDVAGRSIPFAQACQEYLGARAHRSELHKRRFDGMPARFPKLAGQLMAEISPRDIEAGLAGLPGPSRNLSLRELRAVFNFAIRRDWCKENPCGKVDFAHVAAPGVPVLTAKQARRLFVAAMRLHPELVPMLAIETFAGIRPAEAEKIAWDDIDPADNVLTVTAAAAKTRRARHVALHPQAVAWLEWHRSTGGSTTGTICPQTGTPLRTKLRAIREKAKINPWPQDCLRHTFASVALAAGWRDIGGLCLDLGHTSQAMLHKHYHRAIRKNEAERVFAVAPPQTVAPGKIVRLAS